MSDLIDNLSRGNSVLAKFQAENGLSDYGTAFIAKSFDPFHDCPLKVNGIPDISVGKSVIREFTVTQNISMPVKAGFTAAPSWEFQVSSLPVAHRVGTCWGFQDAYIPSGNGSAASVSQQGLISVPDPAQGIKQGVFGPINICYRTGVGNQWWPTQVTSAQTFQPNTTSTDYNIIDIPLTNAVKYRQPFRVVASAFEIVNTTAAQFKNGVCTVYRCSFEKDGIKQNKYFTSNARVGYFRSEANLVQLPYDTMTDVLNIEGALQWGAEEGCYVVIPNDPTEVGNWISGGDRTPMIGTNNSSFDQPHNVLCDSGAMINDGAGALNLPQPNMLTSQETCVAHFTGLSPQSTFQLKVKWVIESIPDIYDPDFYLASEMAPYDPVAMELYAQLCRSLPSGCMVKDNPNGEWYARVMYMLADVAAEAGGIIGMAAGNGALGVYAGRMAANYARAYGDSLLAQQKGDQRNTKF